MNNAAGEQVTEETGLNTGKGTVMELILKNEEKCLKKMKQDPPYNKSSTGVCFWHQCSFYMKDFYALLKICNVCVWAIGLYCSRNWDGWLCWDDTPAGTYVSQNCPEFFSDFDPSGVQ